MATATEKAVGALQAHRCAKHPDGLGVKSYAGWQTRNAGSGFDPRAMIFHHDASAPGPSPSVQDFMWRTSSIAPSCQFWVDIQGRWVVGTNGRANHAGTGSGWGVIPANQGNYYAFGVETDHTINEPWSAAQYDGIVCGFAAINKAFGWDPMRAVAGHKEYAPTRKIDPAGIDMGKFRSDVKNAMLASSAAKPTTPTPAPKPAIVEELEKEMDFIFQASGKPGRLVVNGKITGPGMPKADIWNALAKVGFKEFRLTPAEYDIILQWLK